MYSVFFSKIDKSFDLIKERLLEIINKNDKVVIIPWSFATETDAIGVDNYFSGKKRDKYFGPLLELGLDVNNISILNCYRDSYDDMVNCINNSDIMILPGGNPEMFYNKVVLCGLLDVIKNYKGIVIGESAGTELQLNNYFITAKNNYYKKFDWYKGFEIIDDPFFMDVHSSKNYNYLKKLKSIADDMGKVVYAIYDDGVILYNRNNGNIDLLGNVLCLYPEDDLK